MRTLLVKLTSTSTLTIWVKLSSNLVIILEEEADVAVLGVAVATVCAALMALLMVLVSRTKMALPTRASVHAALVKTGERNGAAVARSGDKMVRTGAKVTVHAE